MTPAIPPVRYGVSMLTDHDVYLFRQGRHTRLYEKLGAHVREIDGEAGVSFGVWAPNAREVAVIGDFNDWRPGTHALQTRGDGSGIWEGFVPGLGAGERYKFHVESRYGDYAADKGDPFAFAW